MRSSAIGTTPWELSERVLCFHTPPDRRVRKVAFSTLDFTGDGIRPVLRDEQKEQDVTANVP